jgi:hypothetical protein
VLRLVKLKQWIGANNTWQLATMASALALERRDNLPAYSRTDVDSTCKVHQNPFLKESATFLYPMRDIHSVATPSIKVEFSMNTTKFGPSPTPPTSPPRSWWRWAWPSPSSPNDPPQWSKPLPLLMTPPNGQKRGAKVEALLQSHMWQGPGLGPAGGGLGKARGGIARPSMVEPGGPIPMPQPLSKSPSPCLSSPQSMSPLNTPCPWPPMPAQVPSRCSVLRSRSRPP